MQAPTPASAQPDKAIPLLLLSDSSLGKVAAEILEQIGATLYGFLDERKQLHGSELGQLPVLGGLQEARFLELLGSTCHAFVTVEDAQTRARLVKALQPQGRLSPMSAIHPQTYLSPTVAHIGQGCLLQVGVSVGPGATIHRHCLLGPHVAVAHEATVQEFVHLGAGALIGAGAQIGASAYVGAGAIVLAGVQLGQGARIAPGAVVTHDVAAGATFGSLTS